jgi:hypothetical protein
MVMMLAMVMMLVMMLVMVMMLVVMMVVWVECTQSSVFLPNGDGLLHAASPSSLLLPFFFTKLFPNAPCS